MKIFKEGQEPRFHQLASDYIALVEVAEGLEWGPNLTAVNKLVNSTYNEICWMVTPEFADLAIKEIDANHPSIVDMVTAVRYHLKNDDLRLYRINVADIDGYIVKETDSLTKNDITKKLVENPYWLFEFLHEVEDGHHLIIYPISED